MNTYTAGNTLNSTPPGLSSILLDTTTPFSIELGLSLTGLEADLVQARMNIYPLTIGSDWTTGSFAQNFVDALNAYFENIYRNLFNNWDFTDTTWLPTFSAGVPDVNGDVTVSVTSSSALAFSKQTFRTITVDEYTGSTNLAILLGFVNTSFPDFDNVATGPTLTRVTLTYRRGGDIRVALIPHGNAVMVNPTGNPTAFVDVDSNDFKVCLKEPASFFVFDPYYNYCGPQPGV